MTENLENYLKKTKSQVNGLLFLFCSVLGVLIIMLQVFVVYGFTSQSVINLQMQARIVANSFIGARDKENISKAIDEYADLFAYAGYLYNKWQLPASTYFEIKEDWCIMSNKPLYKAEFDDWKARNNNNVKHLTNLYPEFFQEINCPQ